MRRGGEWRLCPQRRLPAAPVSGQQRRAQRQAAEWARPGCPAPRGRRTPLARGGSAAPLSGPRPRAPTPSGPLALTGCLIRSLARPQADREVQSHPGRRGRHWRGALCGRAPPLCDTARQSLAAAHAAFQSGLAAGAGGCRGAGAFFSFGGGCGLGVARMLTLYY